MTSPSPASTERSNPNKPLAAGRVLGQIAAMQRTEPPLIVVAICLSALAGFVDAVAFTSLGGFFASFMSGNSTRFGVSWALGARGDAMVAGALILSFLSGVILSSVIARMRPTADKWSVMVLVTLLIAAAAIFGTYAPGPIALLLLAMAMGAENGVFHREGEVSIGLTYMTGALVRTGQKLAAALMGDPERWDWMPWASLWVGFVAGVVMGTIAQSAYGWNGLWFAAAASAALTLLMARIGRPKLAAV